MNDVYRSYYTNSESIVQYMVSMLDVKSGMSVLEPCAGDGALIRALRTLRSDLSIDLNELDPDAHRSLKAEYRDAIGVNVNHCDTLIEGGFSWGPCIPLHKKYDRIIANPPYGGWQDMEKRRLLKQVFSGLYVKETYALFLAKCIYLLKEGGRLVFIIPDTWLTLHMHKNLRQYVLSNSRIHEIALFPSKFFPGVNFGYAGLSVVTLSRCSDPEKRSQNSILVKTGFKDVSDLVTLPDYVRCNDLKQGDISRDPDCSIAVYDNPVVQSLLSRADQRIGEIADCVTGIYTGCDKVFLRCIPYAAKNSSKYRAIDQTAISRNYLANPDILNGIDGPECFIPIVKGGGTRFYKTDLWFIDWSASAVRTYRTNSKARFQNSKFYFRPGIGVPMVSSGRITASLLDNRLFDQSIVGIFPRNVELMHYLLAFFNSRVCSTLIRAINPSANNSANYIKKIPFITPRPSDLVDVSGITRTIIEQVKAIGFYDDDYEAKLNLHFDSVYGFSTSERIQ